MATKWLIAPLEFAQRRDRLGYAEEGAVPSPVTSIAAPDLSAANRLPKVRVKGFVLLSGLQDSRRLTDHFVEAIPAQTTEAFVDPLDTSVLIGDENRIAD